MSDATKCIYCGRRTTTDPDPSNEGSNPYWYLSFDWTEEAKHHKPGCEWVVTRAHTSTDIVWTGKGNV